MKEKINLNNIPNHIAVIMDGNGRWAKQQGLKARVFGHQHAIGSVHEITEECAELGVKYLTLYAFSTENWNRPKAEVNALMQLLVSTIEKETQTLKNNNVRLQAIGNLKELPGKCQQQLQKAIDQTSENTGLTLTLALSYGSRNEILQAVRLIASEVQQGTLRPEQIDELTIKNHLFTKEIPDPELLIRTSGEMRISNFLLWQIAYTELYITDTLWPDFKKEHLHQAIVSYQQRERRFGKTSEQVQ
ncbi:MAG: isoprenyl transferase [Cytophagales bacterium]|nr:isoprenyl transferase [Cytophagales bacterium]